MAETPYAPEVPRRVGFVKYNIATLNMAAEDLLHERRIDTCHETVWFSPHINFKRTRGAALAKWRRLLAA